MGSTSKLTVILPTACPLAVTVTSPPYMPGFASVGTCTVHQKCSVA